MLFVAAAFSATAGAMEAGSAWILGRVIDLTVDSGPEAIFSTENVATIVFAVAFFMLLRPILFGLSSLSNNYIASLRRRAGLIISGGAFVSAEMSRSVVSGRD